MHDVITGWFWAQKKAIKALLADVKAELVCLIVCTNPSSGLSGCQCCMISVEHGLELLEAGLGFVHLNVCKLFLHVLAHCVCKATLSSG